MSKTIILTGATSGIGRIAAEMIADKGHKLIFTARSKSKADETLAEIETATGNKSLEYILADFASLQSVRTAALDIAKRFTTVDVLINNAGTWEMERKSSADGIEMNFAVNHLAPFLFTNLLIPVLKNAPAARIVTTSSMAHRRNILHLEDIEFKHHPYDGVATYSQSKLCNLLFTLQLQEVLKGTHITANTVHPGYVQSNLFNNMGARDWANVPPASEGARSAVYAALSPELEGVSGKYFYQEKEDTPTDMAKDKKLAAEVWALSMQYTGRYME